MWLHGRDGIEVVGIARDGEEAIAFALQRHADVVLMDIGVPKIDGLETTRRLLSLASGLLTAGTFYQDGEWVFYDVHDPEATIVLELDHEHYKRLVIEVADPGAAVSLLRAAGVRGTVA